MAVDVESAKQTTARHDAAEEDKDILYLIGRALVEHKDRFYSCHHTGFTAELAWPVMESILSNIRPYLKSAEPNGIGLKLLPLEPTPEMIGAALQASLRVEQLHGQSIHPDSPGELASEMVRSVWIAMLQALPSTVAAGESAPTPAYQAEPRCLDAFPCPVGYGNTNVRQPQALLSKAGQFLKSGTHSVLSAAGRGWHTSKEMLARD